MQGLLFDLDGVFYQGERPIDGAAEVLEWVRAQGIAHRFVTNTTSRPRDAIVDKLGRMGMPVEAGDLLTPAVAARAWLEEHADAPVALFVPESTRAEFDALPQLDPAAEAGAGAVVVGDLGPGWDFATLNRAFRLLLAEPTPPLVALGMTRYWQAEDGPQLDAGAFVTALAFAAGVEPVVLGKPARAFFEAGVGSLGTAPAQTVMVGDDIVGDIGGALEAGLQGVLVRTGKFRPADLEGDIEPTAVLGSIAELPDWWR